MDRPKRPVLPTHRPFRARVAAVWSSPYLTVDTDGRVYNIRYVSGSRHVVESPDGMRAAGVVDDPEDIAVLGDRVETLTEQEADGAARAHQLLLAARTEAVRQYRAEARAYTAALRAARRSPSVDETTARARRAYARCRAPEIAVVVDGEEIVQPVPAGRWEQVVALLRHCQETYPEEWVSLRPGRTDAPPWDVIVWAHELLEGGE